MQVKICGMTSASELNLLDRAGVDFAGIWFNVPSGRYSQNLKQFVALARTPLVRLKCIGVTTESDPNIIVEYVRESGIDGIQLHGFQLPREVSTIKRRIPSDVSLLKVLHIQKGKCLEKPLLKDYAQSGADAFILDNFISREQSGSTGERIPTSAVIELIEIFGADRLFLAGGMDEQGIRFVRSELPIRGVDVDTGARVALRIDGGRVNSIVSAARDVLN